LATRGGSTSARSLGHARRVDERQDLGRWFVPGEYPDSHGSSAVIAVMDPVTGCACRRVMQ
jgi:hypothetical protein